MSVTLFIQGKQGAKRIELGKRWLLLPVTLIAIIVSAYHYNNQRFVDQQASINSAKHQRQMQKEEVTNLKQKTQAQIAQLATQVARMQANLTRVEALGQQVAKKNHLADQFDFSSEVGVGGVSDIGESIQLDQLLQDMDDLAYRIENRQQKLEVLETVVTHHHIDGERYISGRPINKGWLSSPYGLRNDPFSGRRAMHKGIDFAGTEGEDVLATGSGVVTWAGSMFGYGNLVEIDHGNGLRTRYGHNASISVHLGDVVTKGQKIASMGSTGRSTGPHVHYEVLRAGQQVNPQKYVYRKPR
ncbi:M23 family metallopeptidase [Parashewanella tropica]|uniref:M23 family metallopeptidase n=1 Tax=Parashewanella tropica TaxID=2547970 RepID=UPI00105A7D45|nr:M23 family metallopeptidase [Parashewanella tropica]